MADKDQPTEQELIEATRARRKKVSETKAQPGTDVSWTDEKQPETTGEQSQQPAQSQQSQQPAQPQPQQPQPQQPQQPPSEEARGRWPSSPPTSRR